MKIRERYITKTLLSFTSMVLVIWLGLYSFFTQEYVISLLFAYSKLQIYSFSLGESSAQLCHYEPTFLRNFLKKWWKQNDPKSIQRASNNMPKQYFKRSGFRKKFKISTKTYHSDHFLDVFFEFSSCWRMCCLAAGLEAILLLSSLMTRRAYFGALKSKASARS